MKKVSKMKTKTTILLLVGVLFVVGLFAGRWLRPQAPETVIELSADPYCDVTTERCPLEAPGLNLTLELGPKPTVMTPFVVTLTDWGDDDLKLDDAVISFSMADMDMGLNRYRLEDAGDGVWKASATLPVCAAGRRDWRAELLLTKPGAEVYRALIPFVTR